MFETYDKILSLDTDIFILNRCQNLFEVDPSGLIGSIYEDQGSRKEDRRLRIKAVQNKNGDVECTVGYINTGVALFPKECKEIFRYTDRRTYGMV